MNETKNNFIEIMLDALYLAGWRYAFGIPGTGTLPLFEQLENDPKWGVYLVRNEHNAGYISYGTGQASSYGQRKLAFAFATTGPGQTNLMTPLTGSMLDHVVSLFVVTDIGSEVPFQQDDYTNRQIQEIEPELIFGGIAKVIFRITPSNIADGTVFDKIFLAMQQAYSEPAGPLVLVITQNKFDIDVSHLKSKINIFADLFVANTITIKNQIKYLDPISGLYGINECPTYENRWSKMTERFYSENKNRLTNIAYANETLQQSSRPIVVIGNGARQQIHELKQHCINLKIPYIFSLPMNGFASLDDTYYAHRMGHCGTYVGNQTASNADWVLCVGISFNKYQIVTDNKCFSNAKHIFSLNLHPELHITPMVTGYIISDVSELLKLNASYQNGPEWINQIAEWKKDGTKKSLSVFNKDSPYLQYSAVFESAQQLADNFINKHPNSHVTICTDSGLHQPLVASLFNFKNDAYRFVSSTKFAAVGGCLGTAMGCALHNPENLVIMFVGDGGILLSQNDLITIKEANIKNLVIYVFENSGIGLIAQETFGLHIPQIKNANGYKYNPSWPNLFKSALMKYYLFLDNDLTKILSTTGEIYQDIGTESVIILCLVEHDTYYSPTVDFCDSLSG